MKMYSHIDLEEHVRGPFVFNHITYLLLRYHIFTYLVIHIANLQSDSYMPRKDVYIHNIHINEKGHPK
jgi:hypothetical protein